MARIRGTTTADLLDGTTEDDTIIGFSGSDTLTGDAGHDRLAGGAGRDTLFGGSGDDILNGFSPVDAVPGSGDLTATRIAAGLSQPIFATSAPGDPDRLFVVEKTGQIKIVDVLTGAVNPTRFLSIPAAEMQAVGEQGLLSVAFHPDYATNGKFYVFVNNAAGDLEVRQYSRSATNPDTADGASGDVILTVPHPTNTNHNGGWISFGPDGSLYISTGDGGPGNDPMNNAQNSSVLLGKILRIDVNGDDFTGDPLRDYAIPDDNPFVGTGTSPEIWALGLRNPWRPSFDRLTGDLYIADVGQNDREEINFQSANSNGGHNYGWSILEGTDDNITTRPGNLPPDSPLLTPPVFEYGHTNDGTGGFAVTGGYVYRGTGPGLQGVYLYADFVTDQVWSFQVVNGVAIDHANRTDQIVETFGQVDNIASFGEDGRGNLYVVGIDGEIYRITPQAAAADSADVIDGGAGNDRIAGGVGADTLTGGADNDRIYGGSQNDLIVGGAGADRMFGGTGADVFDFDTTSESPATARDAIFDFETGLDRLDVSTIDAAVNQSGEQAFTYIGSARFTAEGQIRAVQAATGVVLQINTDATGAGAEMALMLKDVLLANLTADNFLL